MRMGFNGHARSLTNLPILALATEQAHTAPLPLHKAPLAGEASVTEASAIRSQVDLHFRLAPSGNTYLSRQLAAYPYHAGRLLKKSSMPSQLALLLLQCTSGGLFEHDRIVFNLHAAPASMAYVKHAAATVVHSMTGGYASTHLNLVLEAGAYLEYAANASILFPGASLHNQVSVTLAPGAVAVISDSYLAHAPRPKPGLAQPGAHADAGADTEASSQLKRLDIGLTVYNTSRRLLLRDRTVLTGADMQGQLSGVTAGFAAHGGMFILMQPNDPAAIAAMLALINATMTQQQNGQALGEQAYAGAGALPNGSGVYVRALAKTGEALAKLLEALADSVRMHSLPLPLTPGSGLE